MPAEPSLESAVDSYTAAFGSGDGVGAWAQVSARCKGSVGEVDYRTAVAAAGVKYSGLYVTKYSDHIDGAAATASYSTSSNQIGPYVEQRWVLEAGAWKWDGC